MKTIITFVMFVSLVFSGFSAGVPPLINYQGEIKDNSGTPLATGFHDIDFRIYNADTGGTLLWSKRYNLYVMDGRFNVIIGQGGSAIGGDNPAFTDIMKVFETYAGDSGFPRYLSLASDGGAEFSPRQQLLSAPYALRAATADFADAALNASNAISATHAVRADHAANADLATSATSATQAENANKLGNLDASAYAKQSQFSGAPTGATGNWMAQFWDNNAKQFHNGPLFWMNKTLGVNGEPGNDVNVGLKMVEGSLRPLNGDGLDRGIVFGPQNGTHHYLLQKTSGANTEFYIRDDGANGYITLSASQGITLSSGGGMSLLTGSNNGDVYAYGNLKAKRSKMLNESIESIASVGRNNQTSFSRDTDGFVMITGDCNNGDVAMSIFYPTSQVTMHAYKPHWYPFQTWTFPVPAGETVTISNLDKSAGNAVLRVYWMSLGY